MKLKEEKINSCTKKIIIDLDANEVKSGYDSYFESIKNTATIPGFRKGKAPKHLIETHYKKTAKQDVLQRLVSEKFHQALHDLKVRPFGDPSFEDIQFDDNGLSFKVVVELRPEFELSKYKGLESEKTKVEVTDHEAEHQLEHLLDAYASQKAVEDRPAQAKDFVVIETECEIDGEIVVEKKDESFELVEDRLLPEYFKNLVGMKLNDSKSFDVKFPKDYYNDQFKDKNVKFNVTLKEIKEKILPEVDEAFLKNLGDFKSKEDLLASIKKDITTQKEAQEKSKLEMNLLNQICEKTKFDLPKSLIERRKSELIESQKQQFMYQGIPPEEVEKQMDKIMESCEKEAKRQVQVAFILDKISETEKIEVNDTDLSQKFYELSKRYQRKVEEIREYYEKNNMVDSLRAEIRNDKAVDVIRDNAILK